MVGTIILSFMLVLNGLSLVRLDRSNDVTNNNNNPIIKFIQKKLPSDMKNKLLTLKAFHNITLILNVIVMFLIVTGFIVV